MAEHLVKTLCHIVFILKLYSKFLLGLFHCPAYLQDCWCWDIHTDKPVHILSCPWNILQLYHCHAFPRIPLCGFPDNYVADVHWTDLRQMQTSELLCPATLSLQGVFSLPVSMPCRRNHRRSLLFHSKRNSKRRSVCAPVPSSTVRLKHPWHLSEPYNFWRTRWNDPSGLHQRALYWSAFFVSTRKTHPPAWEASYTVDFPIPDLFRKTYPELQLPHKQLRHSHPVNTVPDSNTRSKMTWCTKNSRKGHNSDNTVSAGKPVRNFLHLKTH